MIKRGCFALLACMAATQVHAADDYTLGPDSAVKPGVPRGQVTKHSFTSKIFPGTVRDYWVYVPAQYKKAQPACLMVFQDGASYVNPEGTWRVPTVFDNLIAEKSMPITIGVFVSPGVVPPLDSKNLPRFNRSFEYDRLSDQYARFLIDELLPEVGKTHALTKDPNCRAIAGVSSGAIAAFTAAWERPDQFRRVFSTIGSFTGLRGGDMYPTLIRKTEPKPLRVYLQDGSNDHDGYGGNWFLANQSMLSALQYAGYQVDHTWGDGGHNSKHGSALLPQALRWLWRDHKTPIAAGAGSKQPIADILIPGEGWTMVGQGFEFTEGPAPTPTGDVYFTDIPKQRIHRLSPDGRISMFADNTQKANGLKFGADGKLYACQMDAQRVVAYDVKTAQATVIAEGLANNDLTITHQGDIYVSDPKNHKIWLVPKHGDKRVVDTGIGNPNGIQLSPDQSLLYVADTKGRYVYSFQVQKDGGLNHKQEFCFLHAPADGGDSGADGMTVDTEGRLYVTSKLGVQVCDQAGRVQSIIARPHGGWLANVGFTGANRDELFVTSGDKIWKRKTKARGVQSYEPAMTPPKPRL